MKSKNFWFGFFLILVLCLITFFGRAQQTEVYSKRVNIKDSMRLGGVWRSTWPAAAWGLTGNSGTTAAANFIGTIDNNDFLFKTNNAERLRVSSGTASSQLLKISGTGITTGIVNYITAPSATTGIGLYVDANSISSGRIAEFSTTSTGNFTNGAVQIVGQSAHTGTLFNIVDATTTGTIQKISTTNLTTGTALEINSNNASLNSTNGLLYVSNGNSSSSGIVTRIKANTVAGSGLTIRANGNSGFGTTTPTYTLEVVGGFKLTDGTQASGRVLTSDATGVATWQTPSAGVVALPSTRIAFGDGSNVLSSSSNLRYDGVYFYIVNGSDGVGLSENINGSESGLYYMASNEMIAVVDYGTNKYLYANGSVYYDFVDSKLTVDGKVNFGNVPVYADNAAALTGGLNVGDVYRTGDLLKIVH